RRLGVDRRPDGRDEGLRPGPPPRRDRDPQVHRGADCVGPAADADCSAAHGRSTSVGAADDPWTQGAEQDPGCSVTKRSAATSAGLSKLVRTMAPLSDASPIRVALIDDDSGLVTVLERRLGALRWEIEVLAFPPDAGHVAALRLHALIVNPRLTGLEYIER